MSTITFINFMPAVFLYDLLGDVEFTYIELSVVNKIFLKTYEINTLYEVTLHYRFEHLYATLSFHIRINDAS